MGAPDDLLYEYAVIRYVPRVDREEFVNIGLIMMNKRHKWLHSLVLFDEARLRALYPGADIECLKHQSRIFEMKDIPAKNIPVEERYRWLSAVKSACIQVSPSHPGLLVSSHSDFTDSGNIPFNKKEGEDIDISSLMSLEFNRLFSQLIL